MCMCFFLLSHRGRSRWRGFFNLYREIPRVILRKAHYLYYIHLENSKIKTALIRKCIFSPKPSLLQLFSQVLFFLFLKVSLPMVVVVVINLLCVLFHFSFPLFRSPSNSSFSLNSLNAPFLSSTQAEFAKLTKRQCYWNCCEYDPSTFGTLCRNNEAPYPYGVDCYPALDAANMTCCHQTDCQDQTYFTTPIVVI